MASRPQDGDSARSRSSEPALEGPALEGPALEGMAEAAPEEDFLVARARRGDLSAFETLYRRHVGRVHAVCLRLVADRSRAEDLTQDAFVRAWQQLGSFDGRSRFSTWLHRLAVNVVWSDLRARLRREELNEARADLAAGSPAGNDDPRTRVDSLDLERAIRALPAGARVVLVLHEIYGFRHPEIAEQLEITVGGSKAQLHRARRLLRQALDPAD